MFPSRYIVSGDKSRAYFQKTEIRTFFSSVERKALNEKSAKENFKKCCREAKTKRYKEVKIKETKNP